jgi:phosphorylcholine metabolism protein LicD
MAELDKYSLDNSFVKLIYNTFFEVHNMFINFNISYWADSGSVLSACRHKGHNPIDDDEDLCISYKDVNTMLSNDFKKALKKKGLYLKFHSESGKKIPGRDVKYDWLKINTKKKVKGHEVSIDIFPVFIDRDKEGRLRTYHESKYTEELWPKMFYYVDELLPLKQVKYSNGVMIIPNKPKKYLDRSYGKSWSTTMYVTQDSDHMPLDEPIKIKGKNFKPAKDYGNSKNQILLPKNDILLTMMGNNLF